MSTRGLLFLLIVFCVLGCLIALAQSDTATVSGRVLDQQNLAVVGADVQITNTETGFTFKTTTNESGIYVIPGLKAGTYRLSLRKSGFREVIKTGIVLHVQDSFAENFTLQVGSTAESVTVVADQLQVETAPAVATVIDQKFVDNMPLNGRTLQSLIAVAPGVVSDPSGDFSVNGQRYSSNYFTIDGVAANIGMTTSAAPNENGGQGDTYGASALGTTLNMVSVDALQEFKLQTSSYAPEFGRAPGGQVQMTTKSGSNDWHGTIFEYLRNDAMDANDWFANFNHKKKAPLRQNDFGGTLSGPIIKNKTFFFFTYEAVRLRLPKVVTNGTVPSLSLRAAAAPSVQPLLNALPLPTGPEILDSNGNPTGRAPWIVSYSDPSTLDSASLRIDQTFGPKLTAFARFSYAPSTSGTRYYSSVSNNQVRTETFTAGTNLLITNRISDEFRFNWSWNRAGQDIPYDNFGGAVPPPASVLYQSPLTAGKSNLQLYIGGKYMNTGKFATNYQRQINLTDNLSFVMGTHVLKFGGDFRYLFPHFVPNDYTIFAGWYSNASAISGTADYVQTGYNGPSYFHYRNLSLFAQDTWRATHRLTLDYGLRWEWNPAPTTSPELRIFQGLDNPATISLAPSGTSPYDTQWTAFAPRIGVAYQLTTKAGWESVLRGSYGLFYDIGVPGFFTAYSIWPFSTLVWGESVPFPFPQSVLDPPKSALDMPLPYTGDMVGRSPGLVLPRSHQWNFALEQALGKDNRLTMTYVGNAGRRLMRNLITQNLDQVSSMFDSYARISTATNSPGRGDSSDYNALQVQFVRRAKRMQALVDYTWSHALDTTTDSFDAVLLPPSATRGNASFDRRQIFSTAFSYDVPAVPGGGIARAITSGWGTDFIFKAQSGTPITISFYDYTVGSGLWRNADHIAGTPIWIADSATGLPMLNPDAFAAAPANRAGNLGKGMVSGLGYWQGDLAIRRQFPLSERLRLQFKAEMFNVLNHPNFASPYGQLGYYSGEPDNSWIDPYYLKVSSMLNRSVYNFSGTVMNPLYAMGGPRSMQFSLKLSF